MIGPIVRAHAFQLILAAVLAAASAVASVLLLGRIGSFAVRGVGASTQAAAIEAVGLVLAVLILGISSQACQAKLSASITAAIRLRLSDGLLSLDYAAMMRQRSIAASALTVDVIRIATLLLLLPQTVFNLCLVVFFLLYLGSISFPMLAVFGAFVLLAMGFMTLIMRRTGTIFGEVRTQEEELVASFSALATAKKELTFNLGRVHHFREHVLVPAVRANAVSMQRAYLWWGIGDSWNMTIAYASILAVIYSGTVLFAEPAETVIRFGLIVLFAIGPIGVLTAGTRQMTAGFSSLRHLREIMPDLSGSPPAPPDGRFQRWSTIALDNVAFRFDDADGGFAMGPLSLELRRGETLFLVGGNGSGKSTLALLLTSLIKPISGALLVDGTPVGEVDKHSYRQLFTGIFPDYHLFDHLVDRNGAVPTADIYLPMVRAFELDGKLSVAEGRVSTVDLSHGQRKRLALVQGLIDDSSIYVLDEWAADQDPHFREKFYRETLPRLQALGKTLVVISHDDRYFDAADRIVKMDEGTIVADRGVGASLRRAALAIEGGRQ